MKKGNRWSPTRPAVCTFIIALIILVIPRGHDKPGYAIEGAREAAMSIDLSKPWKVVAVSTDPVALFAARELSAFLSRVSGRKFTLSEKPTGAEPAFVLGHGNAKDDGFRWTAAEGRVELKGDNPRGLLYAVYDFLEALGCRWVEPGRRGERLPSGASLRLAKTRSVQHPSLRGRCLIIGHAAFLEEGEEWVAWAARNKLNTVFIHTTPEGVALGAAPEKQWLRKRGAVLPLLKERGMTVEYGGHFLGSMLPRKNFKKHPEAFRFHGGKRVPDFNFCTSSAVARDIIVKNAARYFRRHPSVDVFHVWPDDILGGGWCSCEKCASLTPSEQALRAANIIAGALASVNPQAQLSFLAYHDTEAVPRRVRPAGNVCMLWAPRKRCYSHDTDDRLCRVNAPHYSQGFRDQVRHFDGHGAKPARVFEYYLDAILFKSVLPPLPGVLKADLQFYERSGAHTVQALLTGDSPFVNAHLNAWLFSRLAWDTGADTGRLVEEFCRSNFGRAEGYVEYYGALEKAFALALDLVPEEALPEKFVGLFEIFDNPPCDVGDPWYAPPAVLSRKALRKGGIEVLIKEAESRLEKARNGSLRPAWEAERRYFDQVKWWLRFDAARTMLYASLSARDTEKARVHLHEAYRALDRVLRWGDESIEDARYRRNFRLMHLYSWRLRLDKIRADHFTFSRWKPFIKLGNMARLGWYFVRLNGAYE